SQCLTFLYHTSVFYKNFMNRTSFNHVNEHRMKRICLYLKNDEILKKILFYFFYQNFRSFYVKASLFSKRQITQTSESQNSCTDYYQVSIFITFTLYNFVHGSIIFV